MVPKTNVLCCSTMWHASSWWWWWCVWGGHLCTIKKAPKPIPYVSPMHPQPPVNTQHMGNNSQLCLLAQHTSTCCPFC